MKTIFVTILVFLLYGTGNTWASCEKEAALLKDAEVRVEGCQNVGTHNSTPDRVRACNELRESLRGAEYAWKTCNSIATEPKANNEPKYITACRQFNIKWANAKTNLRQSYDDCRQKGYSHETCYKGVCLDLASVAADVWNCQRINGMTQRGRIGPIDYAAGECMRLPEPRVKLK